MVDLEPPLTFWVIYFDPDDYPGEYIARKWVGEQATKDTIRLVTKVRRSDQLTSAQLAQMQLFAIRQAIMNAMPGAACFNRSPTDDPKIVETWL